NLPEVVGSAGLSMHRDGAAVERGLGLRAAELEKGGARRVFGPTAGAALYRAELLRDVGLFDERFFSYLEDADLAWRARWRGWRALHNPRARVRHVYSATGKQESPFKRRHLARNRLWTIYKNMPEALLERDEVYILRYDLLAVGRGLLVVDRDSIKGLLDALTRLCELTLHHLNTTITA